MTAHPLYLKLPKTTPSIQITRVQAVMLSRRSGGFKQRALSRVRIMRDKWVQKLKLRTRAM